MTRRKETNYIVVHSTNTKSTANISIRTVDEWHRKRGLLKIGYHFFVKRDGKIEVGRNPNEVGAHTKEHDLDSVSICLAGGLDNKGDVSSNYSTKQLESLFILIKTLKHIHPDAKVVGHSDLGGTNCPAFDVGEWWLVNEDNTGLQLMRKVGGSGVWVEN